MLHDAQISGPDPLDERGAAHDRRRSGRAPVIAELVVAWHHDPATPIRYAVLDMSDGGVRIRSATPLVKGMSGTAVKLLPTGTAVNRPCTVTWMRPPVVGGPFEVGLKFG